MCPAGETTDCKTEQANGVGDGSVSETVGHDEPPTVSEPVSDSDNNDAPQIGSDPQQVNDDTHHAERAPEIEAEEEVQQVNDATQQVEQATSDPESEKVEENTEEEALQQEQQQQDDVTRTQKESEEAEMAQKEAEDMVPTDKEDMPKLIPLNGDDNTQHENVANTTSMNSTQLSPPLRVQDEPLTITIDHTGHLGFYFERRAIAAGIKVGYVDDESMRSMGVKTGMIVLSINGRGAEKLSVELAQAAALSARRPFQIEFSYRAEYSWEEPGTISEMLFAECSEGPRLPGLKLQHHPALKYQFHRSAMVTQVDYNQYIPPSIKPGMVVESVNGECVADKAFDVVVDLIRNELRPVTVTFCEINEPIQDALK